MRVTGPLTCVMACVVWSASQPTVPVVRTTTGHDARATVAISRFGSWFAGTAKRLGSGAAAGVVGGAFAGSGVPQPAAAAARSAASTTAGRRARRVRAGAGRAMPGLDGIIGAPAFRPRS